MKKCLSLFLCILILIPLLNACAPAEEPVFDPKLPDEDQFIGYEFKIITADEKNAPFGYKAGSALADEVNLRLKTIGENHSCTASVYYMTTGDAAVAEINAAAASITSVAEAAYMAAWIARPIAGSGVFLDITQYEDYLDTSDYEKWGNLNVQEMMMVKGVRYGVSPSLWSEMITASNYFLAANMNIINNYGAADPREAVEKNTWSRQMLAETINTCTDTSLATPIHGMAAAVKHMIRASLLANGCDMLVEENGELVCGWSTAAAVESITWLKNFITDNIACFSGNNGKAVASPAGGDWGFSDIFCDGSAALLLTGGKIIIKTVAYKVDNFAVLPWPVGPSGTPGVSGGYYETGDFAMITSFADAPEYSAQILNELFAPLDSAPSRDAMLEYYRNSVFYDNRDLDVILRQNENAQYCYWTDGGDSMLDSMKSNFYSLTAQEMIEKGTPMIKNVIEEQIKPNFLAKQEILSTENN